MKIAKKINFLGAFLLIGFLIILVISIFSMISIFEMMKKINSSYEYIDNLTECEILLLQQVVEGQRIALEKDGSVSEELLVNLRLKKSSLRKKITDIENSNTPDLLGDNTNLLEQFTYLYELIDNRLIKKIFNREIFSPTEASSLIVSKHQQLQLELNNYKSEAEYILENNIESNRGNITMLSLFFVISLVVMTTVVIITILFLQQRVIGILSRTSTEIKNLFQGNSKLDYRFTVTGNDEISELCSRFNSFLNNMVEMLNNIDDAAARSSSLGSDIEQDLLENTEISNEIYCSVTQLKAYFSELFEMISSIREKSTLILQLSTESKQLIDSQKNVLQSSDTAVRNTVEEISVLRKNGNKSFDENQELKRNAESGLIAFKSLDKQIDSFTETASELNAINNVFDDISAKIRILGVNAAIEAARAGSAGAGFKIVSSEIVALGGLVGNNALLIKQNLDKVLDDIRELKNKSSEGKNEFHEIEKSAGIVYKTMLDMNSNILNLEAHENGMVENIAGLKTSSDSVFTMTAELGNGIQSISESVTSLDNEFTASMDSLVNLDEKAYCLNRLTERLKEVGRENHKVADKLRSYINHYNS